MDYPVDIILCKYSANGFLIADISPDKCIIVTLLNIPQVFQIAGIGQRIHIDDADLAAVLFKHVMNVVGADKTRTSRYQISPHKPLSHF